MDFTPGFVRASCAWNAAAALGSCAERVRISKFSGAQPASAAELVIEWTSLAQPPELRVRHAGWELLARDFSGLLRHMTRIEDPVAPDTVCALLTRLGFRDMTLTTQPSNVVPLARPA